MHRSSVINVNEVLLMDSLAELGEVSVRLNDLGQSVSRKGCRYQCVEVTKHCSVKLSRATTRSFSHDNQHKHMK